MKDMFKVAYGWPMYLVSDEGVVLRHRGCKSREVKQRANKQGYLRVDLCAGGRSKSIKVHRLVLSSFVKPCPVGQECAHIDGNRQNNKLSNLIWTTRKVNCSHKLAHGTKLMGESCPASRLKERQIPEIRHLLGMGIPMIQIGAKFGVGRNTIRAIRDGMSWTHIPREPI